MKKSILALSSVVLGSTLLLGACDDSESSVKQPDKETVANNKTELVYYEVLNNGDSEYPKTDIAYKSKEDKGKVKHAYPKINKVYEHILKDGNEKPYVVKDGSKFHIYRAPYMTYGDDNVSGEVEDKSEIEK